MRPVVSVVIPMYNSAATIAETLASVRASTVGEWEAVVVDDGSTDGGAAVVERAAREDARIRIVRRENGGLAAARNTGIEASRGEHLYFLDADDTVEPRGLEWLLAAARETGAAYGAYELLDDGGRRLGRQVPALASEVGLDELLAYNRMVPHSQVVSRRALGGRRFRSLGPGVEDYDLWLGLAIDGVRWRGVEREVCGYRLRHGSMSKKFEMMAEGYARVVAMAAEEARRAGWGGRGVDVGDERVARARRAGAFVYATMRALVDGRSKSDGAARLYGPAVHGAGKDAVVDAGSAAQTVCGAVPFALCVAPTIDGRAERAWLAGVVSWWARCEREGWIEAGTSGVHGKGLVELARRVVHPGAAVERMIASANVRERAVVVGLGRAGRRAVRMCAERGVRVLALGGGVGAGERGMLEPVEGAIVAEDAGAARGSEMVTFAGAPVLVTAADEREEALLATTLASVGAARPIARWTVEREKLAAANLVHLRAAAGEVFGGRAERAGGVPAGVERA
jgi:teichuronic acid biosynthesis glycosyltransferase TuaG